jgi:hypothetical protein
MKIKKLCQLSLAVLALSMPSRLCAVGEELLVKTREFGLDVEHYLPVNIWEWIFSFIKNADDLKQIQLTGGLFRRGSNKVASNHVKSLKIDKKFVFTLTNKLHHTYLAGRPVSLIAQFSEVISHCSKPNGLLKFISHFTFDAEEGSGKTKLANKTGLIICCILHSVQQNLLTTFIFDRVDFDSNSLPYFARGLFKMDQLTTLNFIGTCDFYDGLKPVALGLNKLAKLRCLEFDVETVTQNNLVDLSLVASQLSALTEVFFNSQVFEVKEFGLASVISGLINREALYVGHNLIGSAS